MNLCFKDKSGEVITLLFKDFNTNSPIIICLTDNHKIGHLSLILTSDKIVAYDCFIIQKKRRQGIGTFIYDLAQKLFKREIIPYEYFNNESKSSEDAIAFWRKRGKILYNEL